MKSLWLRFILLSGLLFPILTLSGQEDLKQGYITTLDGKIQYGYIDVSNWGMNPSTVTFKVYPGDQGTIYNPYEIKQFGIGNEVWEGGFVDVEVSSRNDGLLSSVPNLILEKDLVFLQAVIKGDKSLYVYRKAIHELYYIKTDSGFQLLAYKKYLKDKKSANDSKTITVVVENKKYIGQLIIYLNDCEQLRSKINNSKYELESLKKIFIDYYSCVGKKVKIMTPEKNISFKLSLFAGYSIRTLDFGLITNDPIGPLKFNTYPFGASLELKRPISAPRWSLYSEIKLLNFYDYYDYISDVQSEVNSSKDVYYVCTSSQWTNMVRYTMPYKDAFFFVNGGINTEFLLASDNSTTVIKILGNTSIIHGTRTERYNALRACAGIGAKYGHFAFETRYETWNFGKIAGPSVNFLLSYTFGKRE